MIKGKGILFLDGDFKKENPKPGRHSERHGDKWFVYTYGATYANTYEITEYDALGQQRLEAMELKEPAKVTPNKLGVR